MGWGELLGSPPSGPYGYAVGGGGLPWPWGGSDNDMMARLVGHAGVVVVRCSTPNRGENSRRWICQAKARRLLDQLNILGLHE